MTPETLTCLTCDGTPKGGCRGCGGYGIVAERFTCPGCSRKAWVRLMRGTTVYPGKTFYSIDAMEIVWQPTGMICGRCVGGEADVSDAV